MSIGHNESKTLQSENRLLKAIRILFPLLALLLVAFVTALIALAFFTVEEIEVIGDSIYSYSEIISAAEIHESESLYYLDTNSVEKAIIEELPFINKVSVQSYFPNRVVISVEGCDEIYITEHERGYCYISKDFRILEITDINRADAIFIKLPVKLTGSVGETELAENSGLAIKMLEYLKNYGFYHGLCSVDVRDRHGVSFVFDGKYRIVIGAMTDVGEKMDASYRVCFSDSFKRDACCIINVTDKKAVFLRYVDEEVIKKELDF